MRKKFSYVFLLCIAFCLILLSNTVVYGEEVYVESEFICDSLDDYTVVADIIMEELKEIELGNTLRIKFEYDIESIHNDCYNLYSIEELKSICKTDISMFNHNVIERLDGVFSVTPAVGVGYSLSYKICNIYFYVTQYNLNSEEYLSEINSIIEVGKTLKNDYEKIHHLGNYFYRNGFEYAYDNNNAYKSSKSIENENAMPDGVLKHKKAICMGFANVASEYFDAIGLPNIKVRGYHVEDNGYHVWNMVYMTINGKTDWYCVDYGCSIYREYNKYLIKTKKEYSNEYRWDNKLEEDIIKLKYNNLEIKGLYNIFKDISGHWAEKEIMSAYNNKFVSGYTDKTFKPNNNISIAEFLQIAVAAYVPLEYRMNVEYWWDGVYNYALDNSVINEELFPIDTIFETITREQMAYIIVNLDNLFNTKVLSDKDIDLDIPDDENISEVYKNQVYQAYSRGYIKGVNEEGYFNPSAFATRAQAVVILCRMKGV